MVFSAPAMLTVRILFFTNSENLDDQPDATLFLKSSRRSARDGSPLTEKIVTGRNMRAVVRMGDAFLGTLVWMEAR